VPPRKIIGMTWDDELRNLVVRNWTVGQTFVLNDVYRHEPHFSSIHPNNRHIREKLRQTLQHLRDEGLIAFVDDQGSYRRIR